MSSLLQTLWVQLDRYRTNLPTSKRDWLSLIGRLSATKVIPSGQTYLRRLLDHAHSVPDLLYRCIVHRVWSLLPGPLAECTVDKEQSSYSIQWKEMFAIVVACEAWGHLLARKRLVVHCDNQAVVHTWRSGLTKSPTLMALARALFFVAALHNFHIMLTHIPGADNTVADALSRFNLSLFVQLAPGADKKPTPIPARLTYLSHLDEAFCSNGLLPPLPVAHTMQGQQLTTPSVTSTTSLHYQPHNSPSSTLQHT